MTAVDSDSGDDVELPSPFFYEIAQLADRSPTPAPPEPVARAAGAVAARAGRPAARGGVRAGRRGRPTRYGACAATQLARLAAAGVPGADPAQWYGMTPLSARDEPLWSGDDHVVTLSPSTLQTLTDCPLRWLLERHGGTDGRDVRSTVGSVVHALIAEPGKTESQTARRAGEGLAASCPSSRSGIPTTSWSGTARCCRRSRSGGRRPATS